MISQYRDGATYEMPSPYRVVRTRGNGRYLDLGRTDGFFIKRPKPYHFDVMRLWPWPSRQMNTEIVPIREPLPEERPDSIPKMCARFPEFSNDFADPLEVHFLVLFKLQWQRLQKAFADCIPDASFVFLKELDGTIRPAVVQRAIHGHSLLDMVDMDHTGVTGLKKEWVPSEEQIARQLTAYLPSDRVDFNFDNFLFDPDTERLFYIDCKPTFLRTKRTNEHNKRILREFIVDRPGTRGRRWWQFWK